MKKEKILTIIIFMVVLLIPLIYSFFYLKSYWNPYGNLSDMKIAVVNLDSGKDGSNEGNEFAAISARNLANVKVATAATTSVLDIVSADKLLVVASALSQFEEVLA